MKRMIQGTMTAVAVVAMAQAAQAGGDSGAVWWPIDLVSQAPDGTQTVVTYEPLAAAADAHKICALFPHMKDSIWLAVNYGLVDEARRQNVNLNIFDAGGYENLPRQIAQFDDCLAGGYDAIILGAISEGGLAQKLREAEEQGVPVIAVLNNINEAVITGRVYPDMIEMARASAAFTLETLGGAEGKIVTLPGPAGAGWAELLNDSYKEALAGADNVEVIGERFGDSGVAVQMQLLQDVLQAYPEVNVLYAGAPGVEASEGALEIAGRQDILVVPAYENDAVHDMVKAGTISGFSAQYPTLQGRLAMDMTIRAVEGSLEMPFVFPQPGVITTETIADMDLSVLVAAPRDYSAVFAVAAE